MRSDKLAKIANDKNIKLRYENLPIKVRAFVLDMNGNIYIVVNSNLSNREMEKAFFPRITTHTVGAF